LYNNIANSPAKDTICTLRQAQGDNGREAQHLIVALSFGLMLYSRLNNQMAVTLSPSKGDRPRMLILLYSVKFA
jgi:hypothetical protein